MSAAFWSLLWIFAGTGLVCLGLFGWGPTWPLLLAYAALTVVSAAGESRYFRGPYAHHLVVGRHVHVMLARRDAPWLRFQDDLDDSGLGPKVRVGRLEVYW